MELFSNNVKRRIFFRHREFTSILHKKYRYSDDKEENYNLLPNSYQNIKSSSVYMF